MFLWQTLVMLHLLDDYLQSQDPCRTVVIVCNLLSIVYSVTQALPYLLTHSLCKAKESLLMTLSSRCSRCESACRQRLIMLPAVCSFDDLFVWHTVQVTSIKFLYAGLLLRCSANHLMCVIAEQEQCMAAHLVLGMVSQSP